MDKKVSLKRKADSSSNQIIKKEKICQIIPSSLLMAYTYFFSKATSKAVSVGLHPKDFSLCVMFKGLIKTIIVLNKYEWYLLFAELEKINQHVKEEKEYKTRISLDVKLEVDYVRNVIIKKSGISLLLKPEEWDLFYAMSDFINKVVKYMVDNSIELHVKDFFNAYINKCKDFNTLKLDSLHADVLIKSFDKINANFSRLFYEIPVLCNFEQ